jgi:hypothetical protein
VETVTEWRKCLDNGDLRNLYGLPIIVIREEKKMRVKPAVQKGHTGETTLERLGTGVG